ncbi:hypothetical protein ACLKA7_008586 [Drosophila subpalustris]
MRKNCSDKQKLNNRVHWVDPGVPTLPEAEQLIASLMPARLANLSLRRLPCFPSPFLQEKVSRASFQFQVQV